MYGVEAGALIVHGSQLHSFGSDCRTLLGEGIKFLMRWLAAVNGNVSLSISITSISISKMISACGSCILVIFSHSLLVNLRLIILNDLVLYCKCLSVSLQRLVHYTETDAHSHTI